MLNISYSIGKRIYPEFIWRVESAKDEVYITFDDGPHPDITPWVMAELDRYNAKASFFVVGENAQKYPALVEELIKRGHSIGNHTQSHLKGWSVESEVYLTNIEECGKHIPNTNLFRPPYGRINTKSIPALKNYRIIMWDILSRDYQKELNTRLSLKRMTRNTRAGSVIVFHDSLKAEKNLKYLLPKYLEYIYHKGFKAVAF